jgi:hypothetical protein
LTYEQVQAFGLLATEGKAGDPRWPAFAERHGLDVDHPVQWEVEALEPAELQRLVMAAVEPYVDRTVLAEVLEEEGRPGRGADLVPRHLAAVDVAGVEPLASAGIPIFSCRWPDCRLSDPPALLIETRQLAGGAWSTCLAMQRTVTGMTRRAAASPDRRNGASLR